MYKILFSPGKIGVFGKLLHKPILKPCNICLINIKLQSTNTKISFKPISKDQNVISALSKIKRDMLSSFSTMKGIHENISALQTKKRPIRKKRTAQDEIEQKPPGVFSVIAYSTAEEYNLEKLIEALVKQGLYEPQVFPGSTEQTTDVVHAVAKYQVENEPREIYFFREGSVVLWNVTDLESSNILSFLKNFESDHYAESMVYQEAEIMDYKYEDKTKVGIQNSDFILSKDSTQYEKYTFSNAMALSVKLGIWEASLARYVDSIEFVTEDLKQGRKIKMTREEVLRKHGELFNLRHFINLSSDLLDTPDFYWDRDQLELLYSQTCTYFNIPRRTKVMNEKINHCVELIELLSSHLSDKHHIRLEWMIIVLIMVEVGFEALHYADRYLTFNLSQVFKETNPRTQKDFPEATLFRDIVIPLF